MFLYHVPVQGLTEYLKINGLTICDLNQNPAKRPRFGKAQLPTLTTGVSRMYMPMLGRYISGVELMMFHGIPVTRQLANAMNCSMVNLKGVSHTHQCFMAGNSMHSTCVGVNILAAVMFAKHN